ncbi:MAG: 50S ribosomal protein L6 [Candidatus Anoxymicrobium japonicum]|uniref:Large ribosomal subunit protein uL6 n=1 Tax=Candidatus Anoxymicrobium japonicum TaxID=2013648 RepID=A0A2N3G6B7_9ACTN|nr:ribosomal protein L6 [uncultured bacterium]PKQ28124.1 MAG: 50S ribosomal protein L6 [Candidatus Anoxymicrobium japonicum]
MSRVGRMPVVVPTGVTVAVDGGVFRVKGPKGELRQDISDRIVIKQEAGQVLVARRTDAPYDRSVHGLTRTLIFNMVRGVTEGFEKVLEIQGVGYRAALKGSDIELQLGYSNPRTVSPPPGIVFEAPTPTRIIVKGIDKQLVGQVAANIRALRKPDPYKGKGVRYAGEEVRRKVGKAIK